MTILQNDKKFRELILLIAGRSEDDPHFGATKLNKLLFYCDFLAFLNLKEPITGHRYQRLENGPAPRALLPILKEMKEANEVAIAERNYFGKMQRRTVALRDPDLSVFSGPEIGLITRIIEAYKENNAAEISALSHQFIGWRVAEIGEDIPYEVALVKKRPTTDSERKMGAELESKAQEALRHAR